MEEKKVITISLSSFFLIIAIIAICVMGFFIYKLNNEKTTATKQVRELNSKVTLLESNKVETKEEVIQSSKATNEITKNNAENTINNTAKSYSYSDVKGEYEWKNENDFGVQLILSEDGTFGYYFEVGGITGNYTIVDNTIILNEIFVHGGGLGLVVTKGEKKLTINKDNSITGNFSNENHSYVPSSITMKKTTSFIDGNFDIRKQIQSSLGTDWNNDYLRFNY